MSSSQHLSQAEALGYVQNSLPGERRDQLERHLQECEQCSARIDVLLESDVPPLAPGTRFPSSRQTSALIQAELARVTNELGGARPTDPTLRALLELSERASSEKLLALLGQTRSPAELSLSSGLGGGALERLFELLAERAPSTPPLLDRAERAARGVIGPAFDRWKDNARMAPPAVVEGKKRRVAASGAISFEHVYPAEPDYSLLVAEEQRDDGWFTVIKCIGPNRQRRWGFRLRFDPEDEAQVLASLGLPAELLGVIRVTHGRDPEHWTALLDLLLPCRYGSDREGEDPAFAVPIQQRGVKGRLPGQPVKVHFWLLD